MITIDDKRNCCGCGACLQRCPKHCISMSEDNEGFLYPQIDRDKCIDCGLCEKVCPMINKNSTTKPLKVFAAKNPEKEKLIRSSSGGLFIALAEQTIADKGVVFGVTFDRQWEAHHIAATTKNELQAMMGSKYLQSRTEETFIEAEKYLKAGQRVMFTGTPCQIAGLKKFLRQDYPNLLTVELVCHGVPSPGIWRKWLNEYMSNHSSSEITGISFREKQRSGYDWIRYGFVMWQKSGDTDTVLYSHEAGYTPFMRGFLGDIYLRPSCYACHIKCGSSGADISIADYNGIKKIHPEWFDDKGVGLAFIHSGKGLDALAATGIKATETTLEDATAENKSYWQPTALPQYRQKFFDMIKSDMTVEEAVERCLRKPLPIRTWKKFSRKIRNILHI